LIPFIVMLILQICQGWTPLRWTGTEGAKAKKRWMNLELAGCFVICILLGAWGIYYAFFSCCLLLAAGIFAALRGRE